MHVNHSNRPRALSDFKGPSCFMIYGIIMTVMLILADICTGSANTLRGSGADYDADTFAEFNDSWHPTQGATFANLNCNK